MAEGAKSIRHLLPDGRHLREGEDEQKAAHVERASIEGLHGRESLTEPSGYAAPVSRDLAFLERVLLAFACFFRVLFQRDFADQASHLGAAPKPDPLPAATPPREPLPDTLPPADGALELLRLLQRDGRLVDFLEQDVAQFPDADIGAAARVVHEGCRQALRKLGTVEALRAEEEGARVSIEEGFSPDLVKLTGNVVGAPPFSGLLRHRGWRLRSFSLPTPTRAVDPTVIAPAEVEL
jgi:hypothetical protein